MKDFDYRNLKKNNVKIFIYEKEPIEEIIEIGRADLEHMQDNLSKNMDRLVEQQEIIEQIQINLLAQYGKVQNLLRGL